MSSLREVARRLQQKGPRPLPQQRQEEEEEESANEAELKKYDQELAKPGLPSLFPPPPQRGGVAVFDDDDDDDEDAGSGVAGPDVYDKEFEEWYLKETPGRPFTSNEERRRQLDMPWDETPRMQAIRMMRENERLTNAILSSFKRNHPKEYADVVKTAAERVAEGKTVIVDLVPAAKGGVKRGDRESDEDDPPQEGRRLTPQRQAPVMTPPSAGQDEERRNRRRLTPPSEDEFIDSACTYMIGKALSGSRYSEKELLGHVDAAVQHAVSELLLVPDEPIGACMMCGKEQEELLRCSACKQTHYCGAECQKADWTRSHKYECAELVAGRNDGSAAKEEDTVSSKKTQTTLLRRPFGTTSRGTHAAQIVIDKERAARARAIMRASDEAKKKQQQQQQPEAVSPSKAEARAREKEYQTAAISMTFTDQAVVTIDGQRYGSSQETATGERPVTQLTSLVTYAGKYVFRDGRYRFLESKDGQAYRRKYPTERGKTSSAPWEHYHADTQTWMKTVGHPASAEGWSVYIK